MFSTAKNVLGPVEQPRSAILKEVEDDKTSMSSFLQLSFLEALWQHPQLLSAKAKIMQVTFYFLVSLSMLLWLRETFNIFSFLSSLVEYNYKIEKL